MSILKLHDFSLLNLYDKHPLFAMLCYGTTGTGKTMFLKKLMFYLHYGRGFDYKIYTGTGDLEYVEAKLEQEQLNLDNERQLKYLNDLIFIRDKSQTDNLKTMVLLFDDCSAYYKSVELRSLIDKLFISRRHLNLIIILVIHSFSSVTPMVRMQTDLLLLCNAHSDYDKKYIFEFTDPLKILGKDIKEDDIIESVKFSEFKQFLYTKLRNYDKLMYDAKLEKWFILYSKNAKAILKLRKTNEPEKK